VTTYPIDITPERLCEFYGTINAICMQELGREPTWGDQADLVYAIMEIMAFEGKTGEELQIWLHNQPEAISRRTWSSVRVVSSK
jgi:hypothetical protein